MDKIRKQKIVYAKQRYRAGTTTVAGLQKEVKAKFGSGISFRDLKLVFPQRTVVEKRTRTVTKRPVRRSRTARIRTGHTRASEPFLLFVGDKAEGYGTPKEVERRIEALIAEGHDPGRLSIYKRHDMRISVTHSI